MQESPKCYNLLQVFQAVFSVIVTMFTKDKQLMLRRLVFLIDEGWSRKTCPLLLYPFCHQGPFIVLATTNEAEKTGFFLCPFAFYLH